VLEYPFIRHPPWAVGARIDAPSHMNTSVVIMVGSLEVHNRGLEPGRSVSEEECRFSSAAVKCDRPATIRVTNRETGASTVFCDYHGGLVDRDGLGILKVEPLSGPASNRRPEDSIPEPTN
jgi:hypothetical protein